MRTVLYSLAQMPIVIGIARLVDFRGILDEPVPYRTHRSAPKSDADAMYRDFAQVGEDLTRAARELAGVAADDRPS